MLAGVPDVWEKTHIGSMWGHSTNQLMGICLVVKPMPNLHFQAMRWNQMTPCHSKRGGLPRFTDLPHEWNTLYSGHSGISGMLYVGLKMWYTWVYQVLKGAIFSQIKIKHQNYGIQPIFVHVLWMFNILSGWWIRPFPCLARMFICCVGLWLWFPLEAKLCYSFSFLLVSHLSSIWCTMQWCLDFFLFGVCFLGLVFQLQECGCIAACESKWCCWKAEVPECLPCVSSKIAVGSFIPTDHIPWLVGTWFPPLSIKWILTNRWLKCRMTGRYTIEK